MDDPSEHALVVKAFMEPLGNCLCWDEQSATIVAEQWGLNPSFIRRETIRYVQGQGGDVVKQKREYRERWRDDYRFYYMVVLPWEGMKHGLFVELRLVDAEDPDLPVVLFVSAHPERR